MNTEQFQHRALFIGLVLALATSCNKESQPLKAPTNSMDPVARIAELDALAGYDSNSVNTSRVPDWLVKLAVADAVGAYEGFNIGTKLGTLGGNPPLGMAAGLVLGGVIGSGYMAWSENHFVPSNPDGTVMHTILPADIDHRSYGDPSQEIGYLHNKYCTVILTAGNSVPRDPSQFIDAYGAMLSSSVAQHYGLDAAHVNELLRRQEVREMLIRGLTVDTYEELETHLQYLGIDGKYKERSLELYKRIFGLGDSNFHLALEYTKAFVARVRADSSLTAAEKDQLLAQFSLTEYSVSLWLANK